MLAPYSAQTRRKLGLQGCHVDGPVPCDRAMLLRQINLTHFQEREAQPLYLNGLGSKYCISRKDGKPLPSTCNEAVHTKSPYDGRLS